MCDRREQILPKEGDGRQSRPFFTPFQTFPFGGLSCFAPRGQWSSVSAEFSSPSRSPSVLLPQRQHFLHFPAVVEWLFRRILAMGFLDGIVSPVPFHNGSNSCISLPLWNFFSAASLLWASWTALSLRAPSTTALITAFSCRCGKDRRAHLPKVIRILPDLAHLRKVERGGWKRKRGHRRYRGPREIAHLRKVSRNAEKHDSFRRSEEVSGKLWNEGDAKG